jgi:hypothetical protein
MIQNVLIYLFLISFLEGSAYHNFKTKINEKMQILNAHSPQSPNNLKKIILATSATILQLVVPIISLAAVSSNSSTTYRDLAPSEQQTKKSTAEITALAYLDIKIANYTEESVGQNRGADGSGRIIVGLYGKDAPLSVARFLETVTSDGEKLPTYLNSQFGKVDSDGALLQLDGLSRLDLVSIGGTDQYEYNGELLVDYKPILETNSISHDR